MQEWYVFRKSIIYHCELILGWTVFYCCRCTPNSIFTSITGGSIVWYLHISFGRSNVQLLLLQGTNMHDSQSRTKDAQNSKGAQSSKKHSATRPDLLTGRAWRGEEMAKCVQPHGDLGNDFQNQLAYVGLSYLRYQIYGFRAESWNSRTALAESLRPGKHELQKMSHYKQVHAPVLAPWVSQLPSEGSDLKCRAIWSEINSIFNCRKRISFHFLE